MKDVTLDYRINGNDRPEDVASPTEVSLRYDVFTGDLEVWVGDADLSARWGWVPVIDAAAGLAYAVGQLRDQEFGRFDFTESGAAIIFRRVGDDVEVTSTYSEGSGMVPGRALVHAIADMIDRVERDCITRAPSLTDAPAFRSIIQEARDACDRFGPADETRRAYVDSLPRVAFARCPLSGDVLRHSFDPSGLDGRWWNYLDPARPEPEDVPPTFLVVAGAVQISSPVTWTPFLVVPGPERPFVVPELLEQDGIVAVLHELRVGRDRAFAISYFAPVEVRVEHGLVNTWGTDHYVVRRPGAVVAGSNPPYEEEWDFELEPWILSEKLQWIAPDDPELTLQTRVDGCPYLGVKGQRGITRLEGGEVWWPDDID